MSRYLYLLTIALTIHIIADAQAQKPELIAWTWLTPGNGMNSFDSVSCVHSHNRHTYSDFSNYANFIEWPINWHYFYDTIYHWEPHNINQYQTIFILKGIECRTYDNNDSLIMDYSAEYNDTTKTFTPSYSEQYIYNAGYQVDSIIRINYQNNGIRSLNKYAYNSNNQLVSDMEYFWNPANNQWQKGMIDLHYYYDNAGKLTSSTYSYSGLLHATTWYKYNSQGLLICDSSDYLGNNSYMERLEYDTNNLLSKITSYIGDTTSWVHESKTERTYDVNKKCLSQEKWYWDKVAGAYLHGTKDTFYYNNYDQLLRTEASAWKNGMWVNNDYSSHYYYRFPASISASVQKDGFMLYPVPAHNYLNLEMDAGKSQTLSMSITDMNGRLIKQFTDNAANHYSKTITVGDMSAGQYMLQVKTGEGATAKRFTVIRE